MGEGVLPVTDMCSGLSSKRVIQLHRYGQTKTGSITAEFIFIEPENPQLEDTPTPARGRNSTLFQDDAGLRNSLLNPEILSSGSYSSPTPVSFQDSTQSMPQQRSESVKEGRAASSSRVINRNYLQVQANNYNNRNNTLNAQGVMRARGTSQNDIHQYGRSPNEPKRTRSISRSVRNLFTSKPGKRDQSYDSNINGNSYDMNSGN